MIETVAKKGKVLFTEPLFFFFRPYIDLIVSEVTQHLFKKSSREEFYEVFFFFFQQPIFSISNHSQNQNSPN